MMKKTLLLASLLSSSVFAEPTTHSVQTVEGQVVQVTTTELLKSLNAGQGFSKNYAEAVMNDDGTVSLLQPRVKFSGQDYRISNYNGSDYSSLLGICLLYGFSAFSASPLVDSIASRQPAVVINDDGRVAFTTMSSYLVNTVTCVNHLPDDSGL
jgi:hypothetical protein